MLAHALDVSIIIMLIPMDAGWTWLFPCLTISLWRSGRNGRLTGAGRLCAERNRLSSLLQATPPFSCLHCRSNLTVARSITSSSSSYAGQTGWEGSEISSSSSSAHSCPWASRALPAGSEDVRYNTSSSNSLLSSAADEREVLIPPADSSASSICDPHDLGLLAASAAAGPEPRGADDCPNSLEKRDIRERSGAELSQSEKLTMRALHSLENRASMLFAQTHNAQIVCVIWCQKTLIRIDTPPKAFRNRHNYSNFRNNVPWRQKGDDVFHRRPFIPADAHLLPS